MRLIYIYKKIQLEIKHIIVNLQGELFQSGNKLAKGAKLPANIRWEL